MEKVYKASKTILLFLVIVLVSQTIFGDKMTQKMIVLILVSMLVIQSDKVTSFLTGVTNNLTANTD